MPPDFRNQSLEDTDCSAVARKRLVIAFVLSLALLLAGVIVWAWGSPKIAADGCALEQNAAWISADWTAEEVDDAAVPQLAEDAAHRQQYGLDGEVRLQRSSDQTMQR